MNTLVLSALANKTNLNFNKIIKVAFIIIVIVVAIWYVKKLYAKYKNQSVVNDVTSTVKVGSLSYPLSYYGIWATTIFTAIDGLGTDEESIFEVFNKMRNVNDVLQLISAYGIKNDENLLNALQKDLGREDLQKINDILTAKNINYTF